MALESKRLRVMTTKTLVSGKEEKIGAVSRVVDNNRIAVTVPVSVPTKPMPRALSCSPPPVCDLGELLFQNYSNFKRSGEPARLMRYVNCSWVDTETDVFEVVKTGFMKGSQLVEAEIRGSKWLFDLHRMIEINFHSGNFRSIAWIDVKGVCFFPKSFVSSDDDDENDLIGVDENSKNEAVNANESRDLVHQKLKIEIEINGKFMNEAKNEVKSNKRKREGKEPEMEGLCKDTTEGSSSNFQAKKDPVEESEFVSPRWPKSRSLRVQEKGYQVVRSLFAQGLAAVETGAAITAIHRVKRGFSEKDQCDAFWKQVDIVKKVRGNPNVVLAWFGTTAKAVESIMSHGFGMVSGLRAPGVGLYLSPARSPRMSATMAQVDENGEKHIILCRVILGKCEKVEAGFVPSSDSRLNFDTGLDDLKEPHWYAVLGGNISTRIIPEFVVSYRPANGLPGQLVAASNKKCAPNAACEFYLKLISKLKSSLPPPKVHALKTLYCSLKDGKMGRDGFLRELGSAIGHELLRSTIQEING